MSPSLFSPKPKEPGLFQILEQTIEVHGLRAFHTLSQMELENGVPDPNIVPELKEFLSRSKNDVEYFLLFVRNTFTVSRLCNLRINFQEILDGLTKGMGFAFSWSITQRDIRIALKGSEKDHISLHRPLVLLVNILIAWLLEILSLARSHHALTPLDSQRLLTLTNGLGRFSEGFRLGVYRKELLIKFIQSIKILKKREGTYLRVDPPFFHWLEKQIKNA